MSDDELIFDVDGAGSNSKKRSLRSYTIEKKLEIVNYAKKNSNHAANRFYNVDRKRIREWRDNETKLIEMKIAGKRKSFRLSGAGRPLTFKELDNKLAEWVREQRVQKFHVSRNTIIMEAKKKFVRDDEEMPEFKASRGWLEKLLLRHNFRTRVPTTVCQKPPIEYQKKIIDYILYVNRILEEHKFLNIYAADETFVWLDSTSNKCIDVRGAKEVSIRSTGHDKLRITVMLTGRSDGFKCKPFVLLPYKRVKPEIQKKFGSKLHLVWCGRTWFNDELTVEYLKRVFGPFAFGRRLLIWDAFRCHLSDSTKTELKRDQLFTAVIPGGCTKFIQAPDVCWNRPFKASIQRQYENWMINGEKEETTGGNPKAAPIDEYLNWVVNAWDEVSNDIVAQSFKTCGVTNASDGSEDDLIHCFKPTGPIPTGRELLLAARAADMQALSDLLEETDLDKDVNNEFIDDEPIEFEE